MIQNSRLKLEFDERTVAAIINPDNAVYEFDDLDEDGELISGVWDDFKVIKDELDYYDLENATADIDVYVQQISTGKYFKGHFRYVYGDNTQYDTCLIQVFPEEELVTIYK